jgi:uncharacterized protein (TIGR00661 family)
LYGRGELGKRMARVAGSLRERVIAYGCEGDPVPNIEYKPTSPETFAADLASCRAVVCTGGQQLIGEARYFGKPLLIVPIPNQHEQEINARYARREGIGDYCPIAKLSRERIRRFLNQHFTIDQRANGVDQAIDLLDIGHG